MKQAAQTFVVLGFRNSRTTSVKTVSTASVCRSFHNAVPVLTKIDDNSWAADRLIELGEELPKGEKLPLTEFTLKLAYTAPEKIQRIAEDVLSLNALEMHDLMNKLQVKCLKQL